MLPVNDSAVLAASYVFLLEPSLNVAVEQQALARVHRFGQTRPVRIVRFICHETVEVSPLQLQACCPSRRTSLVSFPIRASAQAHLEDRHFQGSCAAEYQIPSVNVCVQEEVVREAESKQALLTEAAQNTGTEAQRQEDVSSGQVRRLLEAALRHRMSLSSPSRTAPV